MRSRRLLLALLTAALSGSAASTCVGVEEAPGASTYGDESPAQQSEEEQMDEVEADIER
jgi:hypothetical protein